MHLIMKKTGKDRKRFIDKTYKSITFIEECN